MARDMGNGGTSAAGNACVPPMNVIMSGANGALHFRRLAARTDYDTCMQDAIILPSSQLIRARCAFNVIHLVVAGWSTVVRECVMMARDDPLSALPRESPPSSPSLPLPSRHATHLLAA